MSLGIGVSSSNSKAWSARKKEVENPFVWEKGSAVITVKFTPLCKPNAFCRLIDVQEGKT